MTSVDETLFKVLSLMFWLFDLFNPPPREDLAVRQKITRTFVIAGTLIVGCIMLALAGATMIALAQQVLRVTGDSETLARAVAIVLISIAGNVLCIITLVEIRRIDRRNFPGTD